MFNSIYLFFGEVILFPPTGLWCLAGGEGETRKVKHSLRFLYPPLALYFLTNSFLCWIAVLFALCLAWAVNSAFALSPGTCLNYCSILYPCWWFNSTQCSISSRRKPGASLSYWLTAWSPVTWTFGVLLFKSAKCNVLISAQPSMFLERWTTELLQSLPLLGIDSTSWQVFGVVEHSKPEWLRQSFLEGF